MGNGTFCWWRRLDSWLFFLHGFYWTYRCWSWWVSLTVFLLNLGKFTTVVFILVLNRDYECVWCLQSICKIYWGCCSNTFSYYNRLVFVSGFLMRYGYANCFLFWRILMTQSSKIFLIHFLLLLKLAAICETKFHYQDKTPPMSYIVDIASNMQVSYIFCSCFPCRLSIHMTAWYTWVRASLTMNKIKNICSPLLLSQWLIDYYISSPYEVE